MEKRLSEKISSLLSSMSPSENKVKKPVSKEKLLRGAELTARMRIEQLFDAGTFTEIDSNVHHRSKQFGMSNRVLPGDGVICGFGEINSRTVYAYSQDRSVLGGSLGEAHAMKIVKIMDLAGKVGCPLIGINDSGGARIQEGVEALSGYGEIFRRNVYYSGVIPQISLQLGPCAGGAVYSPALTDFIVMVNKKSYMFVTGPKVVRAVTSEDVDTENLGGGEVHSSISGVAQFLVDSEVEALEYARKILSYLPSNNCSDAPYITTQDSTMRSCDSLQTIVPKESNRPYEVTEVIENIFDKNTFFEVRSMWAQNIRIGFARLGGYSVGVIANNPAFLAGVLNIDASRKAAHFIRICDTFGLPLISLVDVPGFLPGREQEHQGIIVHGAKLAYAYAEATVPKLTLIMRKAYGGAYIVMSSKHIGSDVNFSWSQAEIAVMGASGAVEILFSKDLKNHPEPMKKHTELTDEYNKNFANPSIAESRGFLDAIIEPHDTRKILYKSLKAILGKRESLPVKKHGNIPL